MARRKITEGVEPADDLPDLTAQQRCFVEGLLSGKTATDAYKAAYDCTNMGVNTIWVEASRLRNHPSVALWISQARQAELGHARITLDQHIKRLDRLQQLAVDGGNIGAAVQAEQLIGKVSGHYVDKTQDVTTTDPLDTLREIAKTQPDLAATLAAQHGIEWTADAGATKH